MLTLNSVIVILLVLTIKVVEGGLKLRVSAKFHFIQIT